MVNFPENVVVATLIVQNIISKIKWFFWNIVFRWWIFKFVKNSFFKLSTHFVAPYFMFSPYCSCFLCGHICLVPSFLLLLVQWMTRYFPSFLFCVWDIRHGMHISLKPLTFNHIRLTCRCFVLFFNVDFDFSLFFFFIPSFGQLVIKKIV